jgi:hypothetical protein
MRDLRRRLERLEAAEIDDGYQIIVCWAEDDQEPISGRRIRLRWEHNREPS